MFDKLKKALQDITSIKKLLICILENQIIIMQYMQRKCQNYPKRSIESSYYNAFEKRLTQSSNVRDVINKYN
jgi:hypothetical protein